MTARIKFAHNEFNYFHTIMVDLKPTSTVSTKNGPFVLKFSDYILWTLG